jgi:hypothetical protein
MTDEHVKIATRVIVALIGAACLVEAFVSVARGRASLSSWRSVGSVERAENPHLFWALIFWLLGIGSYVLWLAYQTS